MRDSKEIINYGYIGVGGQKGYVYGVNGICNTLPATQYKDPTKILLSVLGTSTRVVKDSLDIPIQKTD